MNKLKINSGLASILVLASLFAGWQTLLLVVLFILLFCEINDTIKGMVVKVVSFFVGLTLFSVLWGLITDVFPLVVSTFNKIIGIIGNYLDEPLDVSKLNLYLFDPVDSIISIADSVVQYLLILVKFIFIISVLANKAMKDNFITKMINKYVDKVIRFVNGIELGKIDINHPQVAAVAPRPEIVSTASTNGGVSLGAMPEVKYVEHSTPAPTPVVTPDAHEEKHEEVGPALDIPQPPVVPIEDNHDNN